MKTSYLFAGYLGLMLIIAGCDSSTGPNDGGAFSRTVQPKSGTRFVFRQVDLDQQGNEIPSTELFTVDSVGDIELSYFGKTHVTQLIHKADSSINVSYINYEDNGDVALYFDFGVGQPVWLLMPIHSRTTQNKVLLDTLLEFGPDFSERIKLSEMVTYAGIASMPIHDSTLSLVRLKVKQTSETTFQGFTQTEESSVSYYFAPSLGYFAWLHSDVAVSSDTTSRGMDLKLIDYTIP